VLLWFDVVGFELHVGEDGQDGPEDEDEPALCDGAHDPMLHWRAQQRVPIMGPDGTLVMAGIQGIQLLSPRLARLDSVVAT
jgi:hypothetical protein